MSSVWNPISLWPWDTSCPWFSSHLQILCRLWAGPSFSRLFLPAVAQAPCPISHPAHPPRLGLRSHPDMSLCLTQSLLFSFPSPTCSSCGHHSHVNGTAVRPDAPTPSRGIILNSFPLLVLLEIRSHAGSGPTGKRHEEVRRAVRGKGRNGKERPSARTPFSGQRETPRKVT